MNSADSKPPLSQIEKLSPDHNLGKFKCGNHRVDDWLQRHALSNQIAVNSPITYVVHRGGTVVAFYAMVVGEALREKCPSRVTEDMPPRYPVPVMKMVWLGVDVREKGQGLGRALMKDAFLRTLAVAEIVGVRAVVVDAIDATAAEFYKKFDFVESPIGPRQLFLRLDDIRAAVQAVQKPKAY